MSKNIYAIQAEAALEKRASLIAEVRTVSDDKSLSDTEKRQRVDALNSQVAEAEAEARAAVDAGEREAEIRAHGARPGPLGTPSAPWTGRSEDEWRGLLPSTEEYRTTLTTGVAADGGVTVATGVAARYVQALTAKSIFLRGLPADSVFPFAENKWEVPHLLSSTEAGVTAEAAQITEGAITFGSLAFDPIKYAALRYASTEVLADSHLRMREVIGDDMLRQISTAVDTDAFAGTGTASLNGIIGQGVSTAVGPVSYDDLTDAVARIEATSGVASVIWCAPDVAAVLRKEKTGGSGDYLAGAPTLSPASTAWGLPVLTSANIPAGTAIVADGSRVFIGIRNDVSVAVSDQVRFDYDQVAFRATLRVAGVNVAEAASVQVLTAV
jgi:HK97 family phage major capsid protein